MKKNKIFALMLVLVMLVSMLAACGGEEDAAAKKTPEERLSEAFDKQLDLKSLHSVSTLAVNLTPPESLLENPEAAMVVSALSDAKVTIDGYSDNENSKAYVTANIDAKDMGMPLDFEMFVLSESKTALKTALFPQMIVFDLEEVKDLLAAQNPELASSMPSLAGAKMAEEQQKVFDAAMELYKDGFKDEKPAESKETVEFSTGKEEITMFRYTYSGKEVYDAIGRIVKNVITSEKLMPFLGEVNKMIEKEDPSAVIDLDMFAEEKDKVVEEFDKEKDKAFEELEKIMQFNKVEVSMGLDKDGYLRYSDVTFDVKIVAPEMGGEALELKLTMDTKVDKINALKADDIKTVELNDTNSISFMELMGSGMGF